MSYYNRRRSFKPERDARIFAAWKGGARIDQLATDHKISAGRVYEIIEAVRREARLKK